MNHGSLMVDVQKGVTTNVWKFTLTITTPPTPLTLNELAESIKELTQSLARGFQSINQSINTISRQAEIKLQVQSGSYLIISVRTQNTWVITGFLFTLFSLHLVWLGSIVHKLNRHYTIYNVTNYVYQIANIAGQYYTYFCNKK